MDAPKAGAPFKPLEELKETLLPIFKGEITQTYLPWASANLAAAQDKQDRTSVKIEKKAFEQVTQHYAATSFKSVQKAVRRLNENEALSSFLDEAGAKDFFEPSKN